MHKIFITGGCGFIGSHLTEYLFKKYKKSQIYVYDKITYAASLKNLENISNNKRVKIIKKDLSDYKSLKKHSKNSDILIHAAAESHVDNSFNLTNEFINTNVMGTKYVLDACKENKISKIIHISTDEVYGEIYKSSFDEKSQFNPSNRYSSSKAAAEMIINGYIHSYKLPITIIRGNNIFGTRQHPEKLLPGSCWSLIKRKKFTLHGSGNQKRSFLYVKDFCEGVYKIMLKGKKNQVYNIGSKFEYKNIDVFKLAAKENNLKFSKFIKYVKDRPFNDFRYSINFNKIMKLGWKPTNKIEDRISEINLWYKKNITR